MLKLNDTNKLHLTFFTTLNENVTADFCKLAWDYIVKGPNNKLYGSAANKLNIDQQQFQHAVEALANLLIESCKLKLSVARLKEGLVGHGFTASQASLLAAFYEAKKNDISQVLRAAAVQLPTFRDLEWRIEAQVGTRAVPQQVTPKVLMRLSLDNTTSGPILLESDPGNIVHITSALEAALRQAQAQHTRRVQRRFAARSKPTDAPS